MITDFTITERLDQLEIYFQFVVGAYGLMLCVYVFMTLLNIAGLDVFSYEQEEIMQKNLRKNLIHLLVVGAFFAMTVNF